MLISSRTNENYIQEVESLKSSVQPPEIGQLDFNLKLSDSQGAIEEYGGSS